MRMSSDATSRRRRAWSRPIRYGARVATAPALFRDERQVVPVVDVGLESPNLKRVATGSLFDAHQHGVCAGARKTKRSIRVQHGKTVFVGVVPDDVLIGI